MKNFIVVSTRAVVHFLTSCFVFFVLSGLAYPQGDPVINAAADQLNTLTPQAVPQQTIQIGTFDGLTKEFHWNLEASYPSNLPDYKKEEYGGPVKPDYIVAINSFNVKYEFGIQNKPPYFSLALRTADASGNMVDKVATVQVDLAKVTFNAHSIAEQTVIIRYAGGETLLRIKPVLHAQLGAFVVPHLLIGIVYEPPGANVPFATSQGSFGMRSTASTTVSWGFAYSWGLVQTVKLNDITAALDALAKAAEVVGGGAGAAEVVGIPGAAGVKEVAENAKKVLDVITWVLGQTEETWTTETEAGTTRSTGTVISVEVGVHTDVDDGNQYPGQDDLFIHLDNVLFVYMVYEGKVRLAPVTYSRWHAATAEELKQELPAALADQWIALDPLLTGGFPIVQPPAKSVAPGSNVDLGTIKEIANASSRFERPPFLSSLQCENHRYYEELTEEEFTSLRTGETTSKTVLTKVTGFMASLASGADYLEAIVGSDSDYFSSVTYSSSTEHKESQATVARVEVQCSEDDEFEVELYVDKVFRSLLPVRGQPLSAQAMVAGSVTDVAGRPMPNQRVDLSIGGRLYSVLSDQQGNFSFRFSSLPRSTGSLIVGKKTLPITFTGAPINGLKLKVSGGTIGPILRPKGIGN